MKKWMPGSGLTRRGNLLYHYSEDPSIERFIPRPATGIPDSPHIVWAIDETFAVNYWFPRDCPRIIYRKSPSVTAEDRVRFFGVSNADTVITIESRWLDRVRTAELYEYTFDREGFELRDAAAGYYTSSEPVIPVAVHRLDDLLGRILSRRGVELRLTPDLFPLHDAILASSLDPFSIIRFRNAIPQKR